MVLKMIFKGYIAKNIIQYVLGLLALVASCIVAITIPQILALITDSLDGKLLNFDDPIPRILGIITGASDERILIFEEIAKFAFIMLALALLLLILKFTFRAIIIGKSRDIECFLRSKLFEHMQTLPPKFYNSHKTGDLMAYVINDLNAVRMAFAMGLVFLIDGVLINTFTITVMARTINLRLTLIALAPIIIAITSIVVLRPIIRRKFVLVQEAFAILSDKIQENISGIRVVKGYVQEEAEIVKLDEASSHRLKMQMNYIRISALLGPMCQISFGICFALVLTIGGIYTFNGDISLGAFVAFNTYLGMLLMPVMHLGRIVEVWQRAMASMGRLDEIFYEKSDIVNAEDAVAEEVTRGEIEIKNLSFKYPFTQKNVLEDIHIYVPAGKTLGIIGTTGAGKTTLVNLLLRLYKIEDDKIFIDGIDINKRELNALRKNIGYVPKDNFLFATTINVNIKFFDEMIKKEAVIDSSKLACVYENIMGFPSEFETIIGERGITLSGGQKQRVSIARAVVKNPAILILDDSLSAVDTNTEEQILKNVKQILTDRTGIIISHRISTIKNADEIIFLDDGKIIERGTHEELLTQGGSYYRLNEKQAMEYAIYGSTFPQGKDGNAKNRKKDKEKEEVKVSGFFGGDGGGGEL